MMPAIRQTLEDEGYKGNWQDCSVGWAGSGGLPAPCLWHQADKAGIYRQVYARAVYAVKEAIPILPSKIMGLPH